MGTRPKALVVTSDLQRADLWRGWLRRAGYMPLACVGPVLAFRCPRMRGDPCFLRQVVSVAIVDVGEAADVCTRLPDDGTTILIRIDKRSRIDRGALMGCEQVARPLAERALEEVDGLRSCYPTRVSSRISRAPRLGSPSVGEDLRRS